MIVRAKMVVSQVTAFESPKGAAHISLRPVFESQPGVDGNACKENHIFGKYTPSGEIKMQINNEAAAAEFVPGKVFYVDFSEVTPEAEQATK